MTLVVAIGLVIDARSNTVSSRVRGAEVSKVSEPNASRQSTVSRVPTSTTAAGKIRSEMACCSSHRASPICVCITCCSLRLYVPGSWFLVLGSEVLSEFCFWVDPNHHNENHHQNGTQIEEPEISIEVRMHVLGIDAGGTKTVCLLADEHGAILS